MPKHLNDQTVHICLKLIVMGMGTMIIIEMLNSLPPETREKILQHIEEERNE